LVISRLSASQLSIRVVGGAAALSAVRQQRLVAALAAILRLNQDDIQPLAYDEAAGSITLAMPEHAVQELIALYHAGDGRIERLYHLLSGQPSASGAPPTQPAPEREPDPAQAPQPSPQDLDHQRERLEAARERLAHLLSQRTAFDFGLVPSHIASSINDARLEIARVKATLSRWGAPVEDGPDDKPEAPRVARRRGRSTAVFGLLVMIVLIGSIFSRFLLGEGGDPANAREPAAPSVVQTQGSDEGTIPPVPSAVAAGPPAVCGEKGRVPNPDAARFLRSQGLSAFTVENTGGALLSNFVRSLAIDARGLWLGYFADPGGPANGLGHYNKQDWADCNSTDGPAGNDINAIAVDKVGALWLATWRHGIVMYDGQEWHRFTRESTNYVLPSDETFSLTVDEQNNLWVGTWEGVAKYDGKAWSVPYTQENGTLAENPVHAIAFDGQQNIWVGHIRSGVSQFDRAAGTWRHYRAGAGELGGDEIRSIVTRPADSQASESVWFGSFDGGVSRLEQGQWTIYNVASGLPSDEVRALALDKHNRVWAATSGGVAYFDGAGWVVYDTLDTFSIAFGVKDCLDCAYDDDHVLTGTASMGLTHSRVPYLDAAVNIVRVEYPQVVAPGQVFTASVTVRLVTPYELREDRGDFLANTDASDELLFGTHEHVAVQGLVASGEEYTFTIDDPPLVAPQLAEGELERTFTTTWRVWMRTRYAGPPVPITFIVRRQ